MIVPMRKLSLLIFYRDYQAFLGELREKGVVHIHENKKRSAEDEELKHKFAVIKRIGEMIKQLSKRIPETKETFTELLERWSQAMEPKEKLFFYQQVFYAGDRLKGESEVTELDLLTFLENQFKRMEHIDQQLPDLRGILAFRPPGPILVCVSEVKIKQFKKLIKGKLGNQAFIFQNDLIGSRFHRLGDGAGRIDAIAMLLQRVKTGTDQSVKHIGDQIPLI